MINYPDGPKNSKAKPNENWYKGEAALFLTCTGMSVKRVILDDFSKQIGIHVVAGDMRKLFTTDLGNNSKKVCSC